MKKKNKYAFLVENTWDYDFKLHWPMHSVDIQICTKFEAANIILQKTWVLM